MSNITRNNSALCPDCAERIVLRNTIHVGLEVTCPHCDAILEVIDTEPLELDWAYEDDWDDEDEDEEDEDEEDDEDW